MQEVQKDIESDFWKEIFRHLQHRNMSRIEAKRLPLSEAMNEIEDFKKRHPEIIFRVEDKNSYITWETEISETIKLRLFIQSQIKASLLQENGGEWIKIADAKFPNNPFPEVELLLSNREKYKKDLQNEKKTSQISEVQTKITIELIKAVLMKKFKKENSSVKVKISENGFTAEILSPEKNQTFNFSKEKLAEEISALN
ncbi:MAG: hypothetical protein UIB61_02330 [Treponema sp.]|jgi:hypothetical protein|nr:hypothetical protein [Treponema sp.]